MVNSKVIWVGTTKQANSVENEPQSENFFTNTDVLTSQSVLVRESIQNAIDAKSSKSSEPVKVTFRLGKAPKNIATKYFGDLYPRFKSAVVEADIDFDNQTCSFLAIEDYRTTGLTGPALSEKPSGNRTSFWFFAWATGTSNKNAGTRGKNGVGKIVFPRSSDLKTQLVFSVRDEQKEGFLVFGNALLKFHDFKDQRWHPECRWMEVDSKGNHVPFQDEKTAQEFVSDWGLSRSTLDSGTSIVIPFIGEDFSPDKLIQCIVQDYFLPILDKTIECEVIDTNGKTVQINFETIDSHLTDLDEDLLTRSSKSKSELLALCNLYRKSISGDVTKYPIDLTTSKERRNSWPLEIIPESDREAIKAGLESGVAYSFQVTALLPETKKKNKDRHTDTYSVLLIEAPSTSTNPTFAREGILIPSSGTSAGKMKDLLALVVISSGKLADVLGLAEGPAHDRWSAEEAKFKAEYTKSHGEQLIRVIKETPLKIARALRLAPDQIEKSHYSRWFPDSGDLGRQEAAHETSPVGTKKKPVKARKGKTVKVSLRKEDLLVFTQNGTGFIAAKNPEIATSIVGKKIRLKAGYALVFGESPIALNSDDFKIEDLFDSTGSSGISNITFEQNHLVFMVKSDDFKLKCSGFDFYRDLAIGADYEH
jgi:hypothetical protein